METNKKENITPPEDRMNGVIALEGLAGAYYEWSQLIGLENRLRSASGKGSLMRPRN